MAPIKCRYHRGWMYERANSYLGFGLLRVQIQKEEMRMEPFCRHEQTSQQIARRRWFYTNFVLECRIEYFSVTSKSG